LFKFKQQQPRVVLRPDPVFIIGMHRSGTSALGGALEPLGLTVGKTVMPPQQENPKGFYENLSLTELHDKFLSSIGSDWQDPKPLCEESFQGPPADRFREKLLPLLIDEFGAGRPLIKDPRLCRLLPLWVPLIKEYFPLACFILPIRDPVEVAHSLHQRRQLTLHQGLKLWAVHVLQGERTTRGFSRLFTTYDQLMQAPLETVQRLAKGLGLSADAVTTTVSRRIDHTLRHHTKLSWPAREPYEELILSVYQTLISEETAKEENMDRLRQEYYGKMGWAC
jgi:O-antigen biosynthesis protein